ncbi:rhomboid-like protein 20 [Phalaenopsis equestris]|uniref:rhomboid-like protein 20 n=1 Tax=Phalaenopsis equestris TaxID=78828 RepID=UPI0009E3562E|nr:rhomboid-like protein 20 [Phalaenopsis equestris]
MNGGPSGFHNAPVTRTFVIACALLTVIFGVRGHAANLGLSYEDVIQSLRFWKVIASIFTFSSTPELIFGLYLLYYFRLFERQIGSNKYSVFVLFSLLASILFEVLSLMVHKDKFSIVLVSGPYGLIFSSFIPFYIDIPVSTRLGIFGIPFTDKSFIYIAGFQLLVSSWTRSLIPGICGIFSGSLYRVNAFGIRSIKFPHFIAQFFSRLSWSAPRSLPERPDNVTNTNHHSERNFGSSVSSVPEPTESSVATLVSMGFDGNSARLALLRARNDINVATNILIEAQSH